MRATLLGFVLVVSVLATGCGGGGSTGDRTLTLGDIGWDESVAVANLTKVLLEEEVGYKAVELQTLDVALLFQGVGNGNLDAFQDVWLPNHRQYLEQQGENVVQLDPWFQGQTSFGIAVPSYMDATSLEDLNNTRADEILGIEPGAVIMEKIPNDVIPTYNLKQKLVESSTAGMLAEVDSRYKNREEFAFVAWSPHWMNQRYSFHLLDDPQDALGNLNDPAQMLTIVNKDLPNNDPVAYAFMSALTLDERQLDDLENTINEVGDPLEGARQWAEANRDIVQPWVDAAKNAQGS
ncbi:MAG: glycine betaine/proline transport system substrate-binding protein [Rubrobacteraceae bacterium]|nr:glycine betaine/proline transport system substrate-binding protein [Rubrobacteraceae bacterium]